MINKSAGVRNVFSSVHIERGRGFRCAELIRSDSSTFFHLAQKLFEPDGRKRLSFIKVGMNVHWYLVYNSRNIGLLQSQT